MTRPILLSEPAAHAPPPNSAVPVLDVVVPVHNEEQELEASVRRLHGYLSASFPYPVAITVADNASTDATLLNAHRLAAILAVIPRHRLRDRVLFGLIAETGRDRYARPIHAQHGAPRDMELPPTGDLRGVILWGLALGAAPTMFQAACARAAGDAIDLVQSVLVTLFNAGMALGSLIGGVALHLSGNATALPWISCAIFASTLTMLAANRKRTLPGPNSAASA